MADVAAAHPGQIEHANGLAGVCELDQVPDRRRQGAQAGIGAALHAEQQLDLHPLQESFEDDNVAEADRRRVPDPGIQVRSGIALLNLPPARNNGRGYSESRRVATHGLSEVRC